MGLHPSCRRALVKLFNLLVASLLSATAFPQQLPKVHAPHDPIPPKVAKAVPLPPPQQGSIVGGPWAIDANFKSTIFVKNLVETSGMTVTPILYLSNGVKYVLPDLKLEAGGIAKVDVNAALQSLGIAPYASLSGYMEIDYSWAWVPICATIRTLDTAHSLIFYYSFRPSQSAELPGHSSPSTGPKTNIVEGAWWKQEPNVNGFVSLTNTSSQPVNALLEVSDDEGVTLAHHAIMISPHGTKSVDLLEIGSAPTSKGGVRITYTSEADTLLINGGLQDQSVGYSSVIPFAPTIRTSATSNWTIAELGVMTGVADPMLRFPTGTTFTPYTVIRNISDTPLTTTPTVWWMSGGVAQSARLPQMILAPYHTEVLDVSALLSRSGMKTFTGSVNLVFESQGAAGGLIVSGGAVDQTQSYVFGVVPRGVTWSAGKSLSYWSTGDGDDTMVTLWNPADEPQDLIFQLEYTGGHYALPIHLGPRATQMLNISEIVDGQVPDPEGNVVPLTVHEGSAQLTGSRDEVEHVLVAMDAGIYNVQKATCGSYTCETCNGVSSYGVAADPWEASVHGTYQLAFTETYNTGAQYNVTGQSSWSSNATNVATVTSGLVSGVSAGSASMSAVDGYSEPGYTNDCGSNLPGCPIYTFNPGGGAPGNSVSISITGVIPSQVTLGTSGAMQIQGTNFDHFTGPVSVQTSGGVTVGSAQVMSSTTINATFFATNCSIPVSTENLWLTGTTVDGGAGESQNQWPITVVLPAAPNPSIMMGTSNIAGTTQSVVVGQEVALTGSQSLPSCMSLQSQAWGAPSGTAVGGYAPSNTSASVQPLPATNTSSYTLYWAYPKTSDSVSYHYVMQDPSGDSATSPTATATFAVTGPTGGSMTFSPYSNSLSIANLTACGAYSGGAYLMYAKGVTGSACPGGQNITTVGISFNDPTGYSNAANGSFKLVQLINSDSLSGQSGLDTEYPYGGGVIPADDSPGMSLGTSAGTKSRNFTATLYLMWQSDTAGSIPVPLGYQQWGFSGSATCSSSCATAGNWTASTTGTPGPTGAFQNSSATQANYGFPTWTNTTY